jgi:hypothetical protein
VGLGKGFWMGEEVICLQVGCLQLQRSCVRISFKMQTVLIEFVYMLFALID